MFTLGVIERSVKCIVALEIDDGGDGDLRQRYCTAARWLPARQPAWATTTGFLPRGFFAGFSCAGAGTGAFVSVSRNAASRLIV